MSEIQMRLVMSEMGIMSEINMACSNQLPIEISSRFDLAIQEIVAEESAAVKAALPPPLLKFLEHRSHATEVWSATRTF